jgi:pimeloyl-ACP methyl ester carboxylesterase
MGAAAAIFAAGDLRERVRAYVLESPYRDLHQAARNRAAIYFPPVLDEAAYTGAALVGPAVLPEVDDIAPIKYVENIPSSVPVLFLSGTRDERARPFEVQALHDRIASHARLVFIEGAKHGCLIRADRQRYTEAVTPFLHEAASGWRE